MSMALDIHTSNGLARCSGSFEVAIDMGQERIAVQQAAEGRQVELADQQRLLQPRCFAQMRHELHFRTADE